MPPRVKSQNISVRSFVVNVEHSIRGARTFTEIYANCGLFEIKLIGVVRGIRLF